MSLQFGPGMVPVDTNHSSMPSRAPLLGGAAMLWLVAGVALGEPVSEAPVDSSNATVAMVPAAPTPEVAVSFPILVIEDILGTPDEIPAPSDGGQPPETTREPEPRPQQNEHTVEDHAGILSTARMFALGMIETGNKDDVVGGLGEVSRYQIMPAVWKAYSESRSYRDTEVATEVARQHWRSLHEYFTKKTERAPTNFDMYVLWNTRFGYYAAKGFEPARLHPVVRDRAERFTNLVEDSQRRESEPEMAALR